MTTAHPATRSSRKHLLQRRIRWIVAATISYNVIEAIVAITAGTVASSAALIAFGLDSTIEVLSAAAVAWQFTRRDPERWEKRHAPGDRRRVLRPRRLRDRIIAARTDRTSRCRAQHRSASSSPPLSLIVMPLLSLAERRAGRELGSATAVADSKQTLICAYLSAAVLAGLILNSLFGWWWADAIAGLVIAGFASAKASKPGAATPARPPSACSSRRSHDQHAPRTRAPRTRSRRTRSRRTRGDRPHVTRRRNQREDRSALHR